MTLYVGAGDWMRIEYDLRLIEHAVFQAARCDRRVDIELHDTIDPVYQIPAGRDRELTFQKKYASLFLRFGLNHVIDDLLADYPIVCRIIERCIIREAVRRTAESAELFVKKAEGSSDENKTLIIQVAAASLLEPHSLQYLLHRELLHVADMLDSNFQYAPQNFGGTPARQNLMRDRYRLLWDIYVEARLCRQGLSDQRMVSHQKEMFARLFGCDEDSPCDSRFDAIFEAPSLTHPQLITWATQSVQAPFMEKCPN